MRAICEEARTDQAVASADFNQRKYKLTDLIVPVVTVQAGAYPYTRD